LLEDADKNCRLKRAVKIVDKPKILADPVRREILRLLVIQPQTATQLAEKLNLTKSTVGHHIQLLLKAKLIRIKRAEPGPHGIVEKYYEPVALVFIEDYSKISKEERKYFLNIHIERLRGMFSAFQLMMNESGSFKAVRESWESSIKGSSRHDLLNELANETLKRITQVGEKYENVMTNLDGETILTKIYSETFRMIISRGVWKKVFANISEAAPLICK